MLFGKKEELRNAIDLNRQGLIGKGVDRVEGPLKVTGQVKYAYEYEVAGQKAAFGYILGSSIAKGEITGIETSAAEAVPGVLLVMTYKNAPKQKGANPTAEDRFTSPKPYLDNSAIRYHGEPVAFVVAETFEAARAAAALIRVSYDKAADAKFRVGPNTGEGYEPKPGAMGKPDSSHGDFQPAFNAAPVKVDATYTTPYQIHNAMELHATLSVWEGDKLTVYSAQQLAVEAQKAIVNTLSLGKDDAQVICKYIGGGFGGKLPVQCDVILSAMAARELKRPVKVAMTRQQVFFNATHRAETIQHLRLGATADGVLTAIGHECFAQTSTFDEYLEMSASCTRALYAAPNRVTSHRLVKLDLPPSGSMRAPGEASGMLALEQAMDELAVKLDMDPIELRIRNEPVEDPEKKIPFASRALIPCMREGARLFGWDNRNRKPGGRREGQWLIGHGMCAAFRPNLMQKSSARVMIDANGHITAQMAMTDIGTGTYTVMTQIAAETMGLPLGMVTVEMGDSSLPPTPGSGGSWGANSAGSGLFEACMALREKLAETAVGDAQSPLYKLDAKTADFEGGRIVIEGKTENLAALVRRASPQGLEAEGSISKPASYSEFTQASYGAFFCEVGVDVDTAEIRLRRMLGVFAAGRILNEKTARSQVIGGMIWGVGAALQEEAVVDNRWGQFINHDLAEYHVPVHADIPDIEAVFLPEVDDKTGPLKIKGVGELGICGAGAVVANAVFNATGIRVRDYPLTLEKLLNQMPAVA